MRDFLNKTTRRMIFHMLPAVELARFSGRLKSYASNLCARREHLSQFRAVRPEVCSAATIVCSAWLSDVPSGMRNIHGMLVDVRA